MVNKVEIKIPVDLCPNSYIDNLIVCIARCGYSPYYNEYEKLVCFTGEKDELVHDIKER